MVIPSSYHRGFQIVDSGPRRRLKRDRTDNCSGNPGASPTPTPTVERDESNRFACMNLVKKRLSRLLKHCKVCPREEKQRIRQELDVKKAAGGPSQNTRSKTAQHTAQQQPPTLSDKIKPAAAGRLAHFHSNPGCDIILKHSDASLTCHGRCDDGSNETLISPRVSKMAAVNGIGKIKQIKPRTVQEAFKQ